MSGAGRPATRGPRLWLALAGALIVLGLAPVLTAAAASARLAGAGTAPGVVHPGDSVTVTITADRQVSHSQCLAFLDRQALPAPRCVWTDTTPTVVPAPTTDSSSPAVVTTVDVTVTVPLTTRPGEHVLVVQADKESARRILQVASPTAVVPDLIGMHLPDAAQALRDSHLVLEQPRSTAGVVASQHPDPGTSVDAGSGVSVTMRATSALVLVPDLVRGTVGDAQTLLGRRGLRLAPGGLDPQRIVATQTPRAGRRVARGSAVTVTLSPATVAVTDVNGTTGDTGVVHLVLQIGRTAGTFVLGVAAGLVAARLRRSHTDRKRKTHPVPVVRLHPRPDPSLQVRLLESPAERPSVNVRLEAHDDERVDPVLLEVSS